MSARLTAMLLFVAAAVFALALAILAAFHARPAAAGWLTGFVFWCAPPLGSLVWLMIHRLTGGSWGLALRPIFVPAAALVPVVGLLLIPALVAMPVLYPWMHGESGVIPSVAHIYLNVPSFVTRSVIAFVGWSVLALAIPGASGARGMLLSALGLVFYCVLISLVPVDWILALEHPFTSESFGASIAITHLIAALAWAAVLAPPEGEAAADDLGSLLLAMVLSIAYVDFMALLVIWYGDLPDKVFWIAERNALPWWALGLGAFALGCAVPILALLLARVRKDRRLLRVIGAVQLLGLAAYDAYLVVPPFGWIALIAAALALIAMGAFLLALILSGLPATLLERLRPADVR